jgi:pimeloyl-ACP methyl ester carboxylesterase
MNIEFRMKSWGTARPVLLTALAAAITGLAGCGGDDTPARGSLIDTPFVVATLPKAAFNTNQLTGLAGGPAICDVKVVSLNYVTIGVSGEQTNASGVMLVPFGPDCTAPTGLVAYAKGTDVEKPRTLANPADNETLLLAGIYAARGYAVVATDYLGFAKSNYSYHPYLHADSEASSVIDSIRAARNAASGVGSSLSGKVMLTGYSQGGHASMAAHRAIERDNAAEINVVAGAHLAGPYNLSGSLKSNAVIAGYQFFVPYLVTAWQKVYGTVYSKVGDAFKAPYDGYIETLLPSATLNYTTLVTSGKLPGGPTVTPTQARDAVFQSAFITDAQTNVNNGLYLAGKKNDLLGWSPKSKLLLCGGAGDPTVPPALHQAPMKADFDSRNLTNVSTVDVDALVRATYGSGGLAPTDPIAAAIYFGSYHGEYEPPFCHARAKALFDTVK